MNRKEHFGNILDECIERVMRGEDVKSCLARYPEHAAELEPLLKTVFGARQAVDITPRPEFRQRAAYEFQEAIRDMPVKESRGFFKWQLRWVVPVAVVLVVLGAGSSTVIAAGNSLPDEPLYKVKLATEAVQLAFTPSDLGKAELYAKFADKRVDEIVALADKGEAKQIDTATDRMNTQLIAMANLTGNNAAAGEGETTSAILQVSAPETYESMDAQAKQAPVALEPVPLPAATPTPTETAQGAPPSVVVVAPPPPEDTTTTAEPEPVTVPPPSVDTNTPQPSASFTPLPASREQAPMFAAAESPGTVEDSGSGMLGGSFEKDETLDRQEKLKRILSDKIREHLEKLQEELEKAPDELKPALRRAIEVIINGYETNLSNLR
jgi:hypothetical protein